MLDQEMLNPSLLDHIDIYREMWKTHGIITITNFLTEDHANSLNFSLLSISDDKWLVSLHPYIDNQYLFCNTPENKEHIINGTKSANECYERGGFGYCFQRYEGSDSVLFQDFITSKPILDIIHSITGLDVTRQISIFASCYGANSFLSTHTDTGRGSIAVVYNLTKDWKESNGGCFELLDSDHKTLKRRIVPTFNSLTLFDVRGQGVPHRVTRINSDVTEKRLAISGWLV